MKVVTPQQMNQIDEATIKVIGIPGIVLMENAAISVAAESANFLGSLEGKNIFIFGGKGNNGGDAFAAARHLYNKGANVHIYAAFEKQLAAGDCALNFKILEAMGVKIIEIDDLQHINELHSKLQSAHLIIDGIFGTGFKGKVEGLHERLINAINRSLKSVISIDIPSGVCGTTGMVNGACVKAHKTVTLGLLKTGLLNGEGSLYTGEIVVADISIPKNAIETLDIKVKAINAIHVSKNIPVRKKNSNKGNYGRLLIVSGSTGMAGAGCLAGGAALRAGAGLVYMGVPQSMASIYDAMLAETITIPITDNGKGFFTPESVNEILEQMGRMNVAAIGPGLSNEDETAEAVYKILEKATCPLVIDADALNIISRNIECLKKLKQDAILTPHPGEMARLTGKSIEEIQNNRLEVAREFAKMWKVIVVLKGSNTIIASPKGHVYINTTGNPGMATAGTGDVLCGIITALFGQGLKLLDAAVVGVYLHGLAGDRAAKIKGEHGIIASDLVEEVPFAIKQILHGEFFNPLYPLSID